MAWRQATAEVDLLAGCIALFQAGKDVQLDLHGDREGRVEAPLKQIATNIGLERAVVIEQRRYLLISDGVDQRRAA